MLETVRTVHPTCKKKYTGAIGGGDVWTFMPTGLGDIVKFTCKCGETIDLTEYETW
jgi:hypothetical protein